MLLQGTLFQEDRHKSPCLRHQLLKTSRKSWLSHRHTYSSTAACGQDPSTLRPPIFRAFLLSLSFPDPYAPAVHRRHNLYVSCLLILLKHFAPSKKFRFKYFFSFFFFFYCHWAVNFSQSKFLPLSQSHVDIALYLWNEDGYDSLPPLLLR